jgi:hypothetical protein
MAFFYPIFVNRGIFTWIFLRHIGEIFYKKARESLQKLPFFCGYNSGKNTVKKR